MDDLVNDRGKLQPNVVVPPTLNVNPVDIPSHVDTKGRAGRQYAIELERIARHNLRSAMEARQVLSEHHDRLEVAVTAHAQAEWVNAGLKREIERLRDEDGQRAAHIRADALRDARAKVSRELEDAALELNRLECILGEHDSLVHEYSSRLREEQNASLALRDELERSEIARRRAEESLALATDRARGRVEEDYERAAEAEAALVAMRAERDRLAQKLEVLRDSESVIEQLTADLERKAREVTRLGDTIEALHARVESAKGAAATAGELRRDAEARRDAAEHRAAEADDTIETMAERIAELEARVEDERARVRESEQRHAATRNELRDAMRAGSAARDALTAAADAVQESHDARLAADAELEALRRRVSELESALPPAPAPEPEPGPAPKAAKAARATPAKSTTGKPAKPAARKPAAPKAKPVPEAEAEAEPETVPVPVPEAEPEPEPVVAAEPEPEPAPEPEPESPAKPSPTATFTPEGLRRSAMAELTSLAATSTNDNLTPRRR